MPDPKRPSIKQTGGVWGLNETYSETEEGYYKYGGPQQGVAFGTNYAGELGQNTAGHPTLVSSPVQIMGGGFEANAYESIQVHSGAVRAVKRDGTLWTWGSSDNGMLGLNQGPGNNRSSPVQIPGNWLPIMDYTRMFTNNSSNCQMAMRQGFGAESPQYQKKLFMWGHNYKGKLGQGQGPGQLTAASSPVQIPGYWTCASGGGSGGPFAAIDSAGHLFTWGEQDNGSLGLNETYSSSKKAKSSPTQVPGVWKDINCGSYIACALKADGTTWGWGANGGGALGLNSTTKYSSPVQLPGTNWKKVCAGGYQVVARINHDNELWVSGTNTRGFLMDNTSVNRSSPIQIPGSWQDYFYGSGDTVYGLKTDGTMWATGINPYGQIPGHDTLSPSNSAYSSPVQVAGIWKEVGPGGVNTLGVKYG